jgi:ABC-type transport system involved in multi-copper enzyme maturation permease subunit
MRVMPIRTSSWGEGKVIAAWLAAGVGLIVAGFWLSLEEEIILWLGWLVGLGALLGHIGRRMVGPLFFYDVIRTARRNRVIPLRCFYGIGLTVALFGVYASWFGWPKEDWREVFHQPEIARARLPEFSQSFSQVFLFGQLGIVALVTPLFTAGAVADERERRTLDLLVTTSMSDQEIILGLYAGRMANLGLVILTGLPILSVMPLLGGVDPVWVVTTFVATNMTMLTLGALSILASVVARSSLGAHLGSYAGSLMVVPLSFVPGFIAVMQPDPLISLVPLMVSIVIQGGLIVAFLQSATRQLRTQPGEWAGDHDALSASTNPEEKTNYLEVLVAARHRESPMSESPLATYREVPMYVRHRPSVSDPPVLWKDYYRKNLGQLMTGISLAAIVLVGLFSLGSLSTVTQATDVVGYWVAIVVAIILLPVPVIAAQMISREREVGTLDCLLATPLSTEEIFTNKWQASVMGAQWGFVAFVGILLLTMLIGVIHPLSYAMLLVSCLVYAALLSSIGLFFSMFIRLTRMATLFSVLTVMAAGVGSEYGLPVPADKMHDLKDWALCVLKDVVSPLSTLKTLTFSSERTPMQLREIQVAMLAVLFAGLLALGLWKLTLYEFRRTTRKG